MSLLQKIKSWFRKDEPKKYDLIGWENPMDKMVAERNKIMKKMQSDIREIEREGFTKRMNIRQEHYNAIMKSKVAQQISN